MGTGGRGEGGREKRSVRGLWKCGTLERMADLAHSPNFRNGLHASVFLWLGLPLLFLARMEWVPNFQYWAAGLMLLLTAANALILPRIKMGRVLRRDNERAWNGVLLYPLTLAACFLIFPLYAVFAAWAVLSCDAAAAFFGRKLPRAPLFWNKKKTFAGLIAFLICGTLAAYVSLWLLPCPLFLKADKSPELPYVWTLAVLAAAVGALVESIDVELDDNVRVPLACGLTLVSAAHFLSYSTRTLPATTHVQPERLLDALLANAVLGAVVLLLGFASLGGTALGVVLGVVIYFYAHWQGYLIFVMFVALGSGLSRLGLKRKEANHTVEAHGGRRGIANVAANLLVPALCCVLYPLSGGRASLLMGFAGAIAAALADTASSEIGVLSRHEPCLITTFKRVPHGTNGGVSLLGTFGAIAASALIAVTSCVSGFVQIAAGPKALTNWHIAGAGVVIFAAGMFGTLIDSLLGATVEDKIPGVGKGAVNFACTLSGAMMAGVATEMWFLVF